MSASIITWYNGLGVDGTPINTLEHGFGSGIRIAKILVHYEIINEEVFKQLHADDGTFESRVANFDILEPFIKTSLRVPFKPKLIGKIIQEGSASIPDIATLLLQIKCAVEPDSKPADKPTKPAQNTYMKSKTPTNIVPEPDKTLVAAANGRLNDADRMMAYHLKNFEQQRIKAEVKAQEKDRQKQAETLKKIAARQDASVENIRRSRAAYEQKMQDGQVEWKKNQDVKVNRVRKELQHELTMWTIDRAKQNRVKVKHETEMNDGIDNFERNFKRLGFDSAAVVPSSGRDLDTHLQRAQLEMAKETGEYMKQIRLRKQEAHAMKKSQNIRNRQQLAQVPIQDEVESEEAAHSRWMDKLQQQVVVETQAADIHRRKRAEQSRTLAALRVQENRNEIRRDFERQQKRSALLEDTATDTPSDDNESAKIKKQEEKHAKAMSIASDLSKEIVDFAVNVIGMRHQIPGEITPLSKSEWRSLKQDFLFSKLRSPLEATLDAASPDKVTQREKSENGNYLWEEYAHGTNSAKTTPTERLVECLETICTPDDESLEFVPLAPIVGVLIALGEASTLDLISNHLHYAYCLPVLSLKLLLQETEDYATANSVKINKKPKPCNLNIMEDRESLIGELATLQDRGTSLELMKLVAHDIKNLPSSCGVVLRAESLTDDQVAALDYLTWENDESLTIEDFKKKVSEEVAEGIRATRSLRMIIYDNVEAPAHPNNFKVSLTNSSAEDGEQEEPVPTPEQTLDTFDSRVQSFLQIDSSRGTSSMGRELGMELAQIQRERAAIPDAKLRMYDTEACKSLVDQIRAFEASYDIRGTEAMRDISRIHEEISTGFDTLFSTGVAMIRGTKAPDGVANPEETEKRIFSQWEYCKSDPGAANNQLWQARYSYSKAVQCALEASFYRFDDDSLSRVSKILADLVDLEIDRYTNSRNALQMFFDLVAWANGEVPQDQALENCYDMPLAESESDQDATLYDAIKKGWRMVERREDRGESSRCDTFTSDRANALFQQLNVGLKTKLSLCASIYTQTKTFRRSLETNLKMSLQELLRAKLKSDDVALRQLKNQMISAPAEAALPAYCGDSPPDTERLVLTQATAEPVIGRISLEYIRLTEQNEPAVLIPNSATFHSPTVEEVVQHVASTYAKLPLLLYCNDGSLSRYVQYQCLVHHKVKVSILNGGIASWKIPPPPVNSVNDSNDSK